MQKYCSLVFEALPRLKVRGHVLAEGGQIEQHSARRFLEEVAVAFLEEAFGSTDLEGNFGEGIDPFDLEGDFGGETDRVECWVVVEYPWRFVEELREECWYCLHSYLVVDELLHRKQHQSSGLRILLGR